MPASTPGTIVTTLLVLAWLLTGCGGSDNTPANEPPVADAGPDLSVEERSRVTLSGRGTDGDGIVQSYRAGHRSPAQQSRSMTQTHRLPGSRRLTRRAALPIWSFG